MKKLFLLLLLMTIIFVAWNRQRIFIRDPLAHATRNDVPEDGAQVFINYNNDVLIENDRTPMYVELIEPDRTGVPANMKCVHFVVCLLDADVPTLLPMPKHVQIESMSNKVVRFRDGGRATVVTLR